MGLTENGMGPADVAAIMGSANNGFGFGGDGAWWLLVLFLFAFNGNGFGYGNGGGTQFVDNNVQRGFDQSAVINGITGLNNAVSAGFANVNQGIANGFAQAEIANNARQMADMNQSFANQTAVLQSFNSMQSQFAQCCCDNRLATCQTQNLIQAENAATRQAIQSETQAILDKMCQQEIEAKNTEIANLRTQLNMQSLAASQTAQTAQLVADNTAQTQYIVNRVAPYPVPSYTVPNPFGTATTTGA